MTLLQNCITKLFRIFVSAEFERTFDCMLRVGVNHVFRLCHFADSNVLAGCCPPATTKIARPDDVTVADLF